jgi:hypothetical protein
MKTTLLATILFSFLSLTVSGPSTAMAAAAGAQTKSTSFDSAKYMLVSAGFGKSPIHLEQETETHLFYLENKAIDDRGRLCSVGVVIEKSTQAPFRAGLQILSSIDPDLKLWFAYTDTDFDQRSGLIYLCAN